MRRRLRAVALAAVVIAALAVGCRPVPTHRTFVTDDLGRALILQGANISGDAKWGDFLPRHTAAEFTRAGEEWGFNLVRYLVSWEAIEPQQGMYDETYLDAVEQRVRWAEDAGMHVVIDMHQDVWGPYWSPNAAAGNGAPAWATRTDGVQPLPLTGVPWWLQSIQPPVVRAFDNFWLGDRGAHPDVQASYVALWRHVAERFEDDPAVLGYDLMNEPFQGSQADFERGPLRAMYQRVTNTIRQVDNDTWIFVEPQSFGVNQGLPSELQRIDDPRTGEDRIAYFPHLYTVDFELGSAYVGNSTFVDLWATNRVEEARRLGNVPLLLGEFGLSSAWKGWDVYLDDALDMMDQVGSGWAYWSFELDDAPAGWGLIKPDGSESSQVDILTRTHPRAVAGAPRTYRYDAGTDVFELVFDEIGIDAPTEIFVPTRHYPGGWTVTSSDPDGEWSRDWDARRQILSVTSDPTQSTHTITIRPR